MRTNIKRCRRINSTDEILKALENVPLMAISGDRRRYGKGHEFIAKYARWSIFFKDGALMRELGERAHEEGGLPRMREVWEQLSECGIVVGYNFDGIGGWYK